MNYFSNEEEEKVKDAAAGRDLDEEMQQQGEENSSGRRQKVKKGVDKGRRKAGNAREQAVSLGNRAQDSVTTGKRPSPGRSLGRSFLRTAEKLDTTRKVFKRNFGEFQGVGLDTEGSPFQGDITSGPGDDISGNILGEELGSSKSEKDQGSSLQPDFEFEAGGDYEF